MDNASLDPLSPAPAAPQARLRIRHVSDLHLEFWIPGRYTQKFGQFSEDIRIALSVAEYVEAMIPNDCYDKDSLLVLAGDIEQLLQKRGKYLLGILCPRFRHVLLVPGNHDFYGTVPPLADLEFSTLEEGYSNLRVAPGIGLKEFDFDGVRVLAGTMWADCGDPGSAEEYVIRGMYDFRRIEKVRGYPILPDDMRSWYNRFKDDLSAKLSEPTDKPTVIVTHHLPLMELLDMRHSPSRSDRMFASPSMLPVFLGFRPTVDIRAWIFGHTHLSNRATMHGTRFVSNPVGYPVTLAPSEVSPLKGPTENPLFEPVDTFII